MAYIFISSVSNFVLRVKSHCLQLNLCRNNKNLQSFGHTFFFKSLNKSLLNYYYYFNEIGVQTLVSAKIVNHTKYSDSSFHSYAGFSSTNSQQ